MRRFLKAVSRVIPDETYVRLLYLKAHGRMLNLKQPRTFNEKLQWYKLNYRDPLMSILSDKYAVRGHLEAAGHGGLLNEMYGVYDRVEEIDLDALPQRFVIKATHGSNMNIICRDRQALDWDRCRTALRRWLRINFHSSGRQWAYRDIRPRLICEKYLENEEFGELLDYKFYCFSGQPEVLWVCSGRHGRRGVAYSAYDMNWQRMNVCKGRPASELAIAKPENFAAMVAVARELCAGFPFVRVDLYLVRQKLIFGEFTFYPDSGTNPFTPDAYNRFFGDLFVLPGPAAADRRR